MNRPRRGHLLGEERKRRILNRSIQRKSQRLISPLLSVLLVWLLIGGYFLSPPAARRALAGTPVKASHISKLSDDLQAAIQKSPQGLIPVVISSPSKPSNSLWSAIINSGGKNQRNFNRVPQLAVKLPGFVVNALATRPDVLHISLDRPTQMTGHLETTTGAQNARNNTSPGTGQIDGEGIGIAILDSGIDADHHSFGAPGQGWRVIASVDFTGEGTTEDLYGHGTHVASIAAGSDHVAYGAYTGVAPKANLINVRVLGALRSGSASAKLAG